KDLEVVRLIDVPVEPIVSNLVFPEVRHKGRLPVRRAGHHARRGEGQCPNEQGRNAQPAHPHRVTSTIKSEARGPSSNLTPGLDSLLTSRGRRSLGTVDAGRSQCSKGRTSDATPKRWRIARHDVVI